jgi:dolichol-phosphate mannosyltransferase
VSGFLVNVLAVTFLSWIGIPLKVTFALGILIAMSSNFLLNRSITFDHGISASFFRQYFQFVAACAVGAVINYIASLLFLAEFPQFAQMPQVPVVVGSIAGLVSNFIFSRYIVFGKNLILNQKK